LNVEIGLQLGDFSIVIGTVHRAEDLVRLRLITSLEIFSGDGVKRKRRNSEGLLDVHIIIILLLK
jgi:hypothetical protein